MVNLGFLPDKQTISYVVQISSTHVLNGIRALTYISVIVVGRFCAVWELDSCLSNSPEYHAQSSGVNPAVT